MKSIVINNNLPRESVITLINDNVNNPNIKKKRSCFFSVYILPVIAVVAC